MPKYRACKAQQHSCIHVDATGAKLVAGGVGLHDVMDWLAAYQCPPFPAKLFLPV